MLGLIFVILALTGVFIAFGIKYRQVRRKLLQCQIQHLLYLHALDLHNLFNALNKLAALIMSYERQQAYEFLISFSKILKNRLTFEPQLTWALHDELHFIEAYHEALAQSGNMVPKWELPAGLDNLNMKIPVLSLYSLYRKFTFGENIESATLQILLKNDDGEVQIVLKMIDFERSGQSSDHARSAEILQLYRKYFGRRFRFFFRESDGEAEIFWKE
jgi:LytS/YehU family sensor histidine kinase